MHESEMKQSANYTDEERKVMALTALAENCEQAFSSTLLDTWLDLLTTYTPTQIDAAIRILLRTYPDPHYPNKKLPPFSIMQAALDRICPRLELEKAVELAANCEWVQLLEEIRSKGRYSTPVLSPTTQKAITVLGGWNYLCMTSEEALMRLRRTFLERWQSMSELACRVGGQHCNASKELQHILQGQLPAGSIMIEQVVSLQSREEERV